MKMHVQFLAALVIIQMVGCSTTIVTAKGGYSDVIVQLNSNSEEKYYLRSPDFYSYLSKAKSRNGVLKFSIKYLHKSDNCLYVTDEDGNILETESGDYNGFRNYLWSDYAELYYKEEWFEKKIDKYKEEIIAHESNLQNASTWLNDNRQLYVDYQCIRPPLSERPALVCDEYERDDKSKGICIVQAAGCSGASMMLGNIVGGMVVDFVSGTTCDLIAEELIKPNRSAIPTIAKNAFLSFVATYLGIGGKALAGLVVTKEYFDCVDTVKDVCTTNYVRWINEPVLAQKTCLKAVQTLRNEPARIETYRDYLRSSYQELAGIRLSRSKIERRTENFNIGCSIKKDK